MRKELRSSTWAWARLEVGMIKHEWQSWQRWQARVFGFASAWWLALAPSAASWQWKAATGSELSHEAQGWLGVFYLLLVIGLFVAATTLGTSECKQSMRASRWFLFGLLWLPLALLFVR